MLGRRMKAIVRGAEYCADLSECRGRDVDWFSDIRRLRDLRKRRVKGVSLRDDKMSDSARYDEHYVEFLLDLEDIARVGGIEEDEDDPEYVMFLDTLRVAKSSYEGYNTISNKTEKRKIQQLRRDDYSRDRRNRVVSTMYEGENTILKKTEKRKIHEFGRDDYSREKRNRFEKAPRVKTTSPGLNVTQKKTIPSRRMKRKEPCSPRDCDVVIILDSSESEDVHVQEKRTTVGEVIKRGKLVSRKSDDFEEEQSLDVVGNSRSAPKTLAVQKFVVEEQNLDVCGESRSIPQKIALQKVVVDEVYKVFLENLREKRELCVYQHEDTEQVYYQSLLSDQHLAIVAHSSKQPLVAVGPSSDQLKRDGVNVVHSKAGACNDRLPSLPPKVPVSIQKQPTHTPTPATVSRLKTLPPVISHRVPPIMKEKLHVILSKPYNQQEHDQLWKELCGRSAILIHRDSRSGGSHRPGQMGRSCLDHYSELRSEIEKVKSDPHKVLNFLRMLSFYLMKVPCGKICKPWLDDSLLSILPGSA